MNDFPAWATRSAEFLCAACAAPADSGKCVPLTQQLIDDIYYAVTCARCEKQLSRDPGIVALFGLEDVPPASHG
jgi:hypothetical protein